MSTNASFNHILVKEAVNALTKKVATSVDANLAEEDTTVSPYVRLRLLRH